MGGGGSGESRSKSKSETTAEQKMMWSYMMSDMLPAARGEDTALSRRMEQQARDTSAKQERMAGESIMEIAGKTGMGAGQVAGLQANAQNQSIQGSTQAISSAKMSAAQSAMSMIAGLPMMGEKSESKTKGKKSYVFGLYSG